MDKISFLTKQAVARFIVSALIEDLGNGDHSSMASIDPSQQASAQLIIKSPGILAGVELADQIFNTVNNCLKVELLKKDGDLVSPGDIGLIVKGKAQSILAAERLVLNCMQRMSGIATYTRYLTSLISDTSAKLLDTRKTTPNFRLPEKWAVAIGGGQNHRFGLFDMIMLKDNHIDFAGGIGEAIEATKQYLDHNKLELKIEVETRTLKEVQEVLDSGGIDRIMLDNMSLADLSKAVLMINGHCETEASGSITEQTIAKVAATGVDYISVGALTHSVNSMDISLKAIIS